MSNLNRLTQLLEFLEEDPANPFNLYALALEYQSLDRDKARYYYSQLLNAHPGYLPTYYQAAGFFADRGETEKARAIYEEGIKLAAESNNSHALRELQNAYLNFQFENG